mmetsp:Transcript_24561/g.42034  ORF Transcript_24561/g.42034 Transcript_24561/m.42034 type:complete len:94 (+) Transcript_24561:798-1079(+)
MTSLGMTITRLKFDAFLKILRMRQTFANSAEKVKENPSPNNQGVAMHAASTLCRLVETSVDVPKTGSKMVSYPPWMPLGMIAEAITRQPRLTR